MAEFVELQYTGNDSVQSSPAPLLPGQTTRNYRSQSSSDGTKMTSTSRPSNKDFQRINQQEDCKIGELGETPQQFYSCPEGDIGEGRPADQGLDQRPNTLGTVAAPQR